MINSNRQTGMTNDPNSPKTLFIQPTHLRVRWPDGSEAVFPLKGESSRIGRGSEDNHLAAPAAFNSISRRHLSIEKKGEFFYAVDLGSTNGVLVNGKKISEPTGLKDGDEINIGRPDDKQEVILIFKAGSESALREALRMGDLPIPTPQAGSQAGAAYLTIRWPNGVTTDFPLEKDSLLIGRDSAADLRVPEALAFVSGRQAEIQKRGGGFVVRDLNSANGSFLNNQRLVANVETALNDNAILRIGDEAFGVSVGFAFHNPAQALEGFQPAGATMIHKTSAVVIGRGEECDLRLDHADVSRRHARIHQTGGQFLIEDLHTTNGTFVNGVMVKIAELHEGDLIQIGSTVFVFEAGQVKQYQSVGMRVDVQNLNQEVRTRRGKLRILDDINLSILPREFVAIVGGSGAGKTTLLNALIGFRPAQGKVQLNGQNFYAEYERYRSQLGFVPQSDILHMTLSVERALDYAARLRLSGSLSRAERKRRIEAVLETVSMNTETLRKTRIGNLSGGQRKRVSIAAELLADPKLIYLDEATSGLDPGLEKKLMHTLRRMADEGRTVVLITHATSNIVQTDHVAFLSQGKLIYFGPSQEALEFFGVEDFADIYERIERKGDEWQHIFRDEKPAVYKKYIAARQANLHAVPQQALPTPRFGIGDFFRQFLTLAQRSFSVLLSNPITLALMLLLFPVTAFLQLVIASQDVLTGNLAILADPVAAAKTMLEAYVPLASTNTFVFVTGLEAVLVGLYVPPNELIPERAIYLRERTVNLKILPYLFSKVLLFTIFSAIQVALYMLIVSQGVDFPARGVFFSGTVEIFLTLFLTIMAGVGTGMVVAAVSRSTDMAIYILVLLLFFEFFFAGTIFDLRGNKFEPMSYFAATRWSLNALGVTIDMRGMAESTILCNQLPENPLDPNSALKTVCFNYPEAREDLMLDYATENLLRSWLALAAMIVITIAITGVLLHRMDPAS